MLAATACSEKIPTQEEQEQVEQTKPKVLYIDSYNTDLPWVKGLMRGLFSEFGISYNSRGEWDDKQSPIKLKVFHMNTKGNQSQDYLLNKASQAKLLIDSWKPDLLITSDDNAMKYVVAPTYLNTELPIVFCGVNWNASKYGLPAENTTGMIEVQLVNKLVEELGNYSRGTRIGFLKGDTLSSRIEGEHFKNIISSTINNIYVSDFESWKTNYLQLQNEVDILLLGNMGGIQDWDRDGRELQDFIIENTKIPTGSWNLSDSDLTLITYAIIPEEQGEWAAKTALKILQGENPSAIPLVNNEKVKTFINLTMAKRLDIKFTQDLIERSHFSQEDMNQTRILFVNSYHKGYAWSDRIEKGFQLSLDKSLLNYDLRYFRMNTKLQSTPKQVNLSVNDLLKEIELWKPHIIIGSDDSFSRYVAQPYFRGKEIPIIVCGLGGNASDYGFPVTNITGVEEYNDYDKLLTNLNYLNSGNRVGALAFDSYGEKKTISTTQERGVTFHEIHYVSNWDEWKEEYIKLQNSVDKIILFSTMGIKDWNDKEAVEFIYKNSQIPSGTSFEDQIQYALIGQISIAEEQGWLAGEMALRVLDGAFPGEIPIAHNMKSNSVVNIALANELGIVIPQEILTDAAIWQ